MIVLSITLLGEFLTANVSTPFLIFMVEGFDEMDEGSDVGFYSGSSLPHFSSLNSSLLSSGRLSQKNTVDASSFSSPSLVTP
jgi:hypothetical protein